MRSYKRLTPPSWSQKSYLQFNHETHSRTSSSYPANIIFKRNFFGLFKSGELEPATNPDRHRNITPDSWRHFFTPKINVAVLHSEKGRVIDGITDKTLFLGELWAIESTHVLSNTVFKAKVSKQHLSRISSMKVEAPKYPPLLPHLPDKLPLLFKHQTTYETVAFRPTTILPERPVLDENGLEHHVWRKPPDLEYAHQFERLEYLGDSVINLAIIDFLYKHSKVARAGFIGSFKAHFLNNDQLSYYAYTYGFSQFVHGTRAKSYADSWEAFIAILYFEQGQEAVNQFLHPLFSATMKVVLETGEIGLPLGASPRIRRPLSREDLRTRLHNIAIQQLGEDAQALGTRQPQDLPIAKAEKEPLRRVEASTEVQESEAKAEQELNLHEDTVINALLPTESDAPIKSTSGDQLVEPLDANHSATSNVTNSLETTDDTTTPILSATKSEQDDQPKGIGYDSTIIPGNKVFAFGLEANRFKPPPIGRYTSKEGRRLILQRFVQDACHSVLVDIPLRCVICGHLRHSYKRDMAPALQALHTTLKGKRYDVMRYPVANKRLEFVWVRVEHEGHFVALTGHASCSVKVVAQKYSQHQDEES